MKYYICTSITFILSLLSKSYTTSISQCLSFIESDSKLLNIDEAPRLILSSLYFDVVKPSGKYNLNIQFEFNIIPVRNQGNITSICLCLRNAVVLVEDNGSKAVTLKVKANEQIPVGVLGINNICWLQTTKFVECRSWFKLSWDLINAGMFVFSPFVEEFWTSLQDTSIPYSNWIQSISLETHIGSLPPQWLSHMNLSSLTELFIQGNVWNSPEKLIGNLPNLFRLFLMNNSIEELPKDILLNAPNVEFLHLQLNKLTRLPQHLSNISALDVSHQSGNGPLKISDEEISTFKKMKSIQLNTNLEGNITTFLKLPNIQTLFCRGCFLKNISTKFVSLVEESSVGTISLISNNLTSLPTEIFHFLTKLLTLQLDSNLFEACPCNAFSTLKRLNRLTLSRNKIKNLPGYCFSGLTSLSTLDLSFNALTFIDDTSFQNAGEVKYLLMNHNSLTAISQNVFLPLKKLIRLDISHNNLIEIPVLGENSLGFLGLSYNLLTKVTNLTTPVRYILNLDLSKNHISELKLAKVTRLNFSHNSLTHINEGMRQSLEKLALLDLGGNSFDCCHEDISVLRNFVNSSKNKIQNLGTNEPLTCFPKTGEAQILLEALVNSTVCLEESSNLLVEIVVPLSILLTCVLVFFVTRHYYEFQLSYLTYFLKMKRRGFLLQEEIKLSEPIYDAFVCYSSKNLHWIVQELIPTLENGPDRYRFCLHDRDFSVGALIDKNIVESLQKSRKVIFLLTNDFLKSTWCQWEMNMANHRTFKEVKNYIIILEMEDLDHANLPNHLQYLIDSKTYIKWPQDPIDKRQIQRCWQQLKIVLGDSISKRIKKDPSKGTVLDL